MRAELQQHEDDAAGLQRRVGVAFGDLVDQREDALLDELDEPFEHLRLAGEMAVQRGLAHRQLGGQRGGGDAVGARLFQHGGQRLQDLHAALARLRALAGGSGAALRVGGLGALVGAGVDGVVFGVGVPTCLR
jgi:hypothetical protein